MYDGINCHASYFCLLILIAVFFRVWNFAYMACEFVHNVFFCEGHLVSSRKVFRSLVE